MKGLLRPIFVGGLSIAIAGAGVMGGRAVLAAGGAAPTAVTVTASPTVVVEGDTVTLAVQLNTPATEQLGVRVNWGDASPVSFAFINPGFDTAGAPFTHVYVDNAPKGTPQGTMTISVRVENATTSLLGSAAVLVKNAPPVFTSLTVSPSTISAGGTATVDGVFTARGRDDRHSVAIDWGNSEFTAFPLLPAKTYNFSYAHTYAVGGTFTLTVTVTDDDTGSATATAILTVLSANQPPSNLVLAMSPVAEGGSSTLTGSFADPDVADTHSFTVNWGDLSGVTTPPPLAAGVLSFSLAHTYAATGAYTVTLVLNDSAGHSITGTTSVSVTNVAPAVALAAVASPVAGDPVDLSGMFTDPGTADTFVLRVDWGDGTAKTAPILGADGRSFVGTHTYTLAGSYPALVTVTDRDGGTGTASATIVVRPRNVAPTNLTLSAPAVVQGATTTLTGVFVDPDVSDTHTVVLNWGEGAPVSLSLAAGITSFTATHTYATTGTWTVSATVTDPAGASTSATTQAVVTAPSTAALLDQLSDLVRTFDLDRNTARWFTHRIAELKASLAAGNAEFCDALEGLDHLPSAARRTLTSEQVAALADLTAKLRASANCPISNDETGQHGALIVPTTASAPTSSDEQLDENKNDEQQNERATTSKTPSVNKQQNENDHGDNQHGDQGRR